MSDTETALSNRTGRAYVSGTAARAFVVRDGETFMLRPAAPEPMACAPAILANTLALCRDVAVYPTSEEPPFRDVHADLDLRARVSACTDYLSALLDPALSDELRLRASSLADELLRDESVDGEIERIFHNVPPPADADVASAHRLAASHVRTVSILYGITRAGQFAAYLEELWEEGKNRLSLLADRSSADAFFRHHSLIAKALKGADQASLLTGVEPSLREPFERWATAAREFLLMAEALKYSERPRRLKSLLMRDLALRQAMAIRGAQVKQITVGGLANLPKRRGR